jgi:hypothetical protein
MQALECCERQTPASLASSAQEVEMIDNLVYLDEREDNMVDLFAGLAGPEVDCWTPQI